MNETFVFTASCICLAFGILMCLLPANRYRKVVAVGAMGPLFLVCGVVLMTTFKWTEVAIKLSDLEVKLSKAQLDLVSSEQRIAAIRNTLTPQAQSQALTDLLTKYEQVSSTTPSERQVRDFGNALDAADVTVLPVAVFKAFINSASPANANELKDVTPRQHRPANQP